VIIFQPKEHPILNQAEGLSTKKKTLGMHNDGSHLQLMTGKDQGLR